MALPLAFQRIAIEDGNPAIATIVVDPRSSGLLSLPGEYSTESRPPPYHLKVTATDETGVHVESENVGTDASYAVRFKIENLDSLSMVELFWAD
jgi:hypothetical protein